MNKIILPKFIKSGKQRLKAGILASTILFSTVLGSLVNPSAAYAQESDTGIGDISTEWSREIYDEVQLTSRRSTNENGPQFVSTVTFNPETKKLRPHVAFGEATNGGDTLSAMINNFEQSGDKVVFALNGDAYDTSNGNTRGLMIQDGKLISTPENGNYYAIGFAEGNKFIYGTSKIDVRTKIDNQDIVINHVNKERKIDKNGIYLLTEHFGKITNSSQAGLEVVLNVTSDNYSGLVIGDKITASVENVHEVSENGSGNRTAINAEQVVLTMHKDNPKYDLFKNMESGYEITISVSNLSTDVDWSKANQAIGVFQPLMLNGKSLPAEIDNGIAKGIHPRSAVGVKADGSIILMQSDGRQANHAIGLEKQEIVDFLSNLGAVSVFNLDGGGSSTLSIRMPGEKDAVPFNIPSDGHERSNANAILFVSELEPSENQAVEKLHVYPNLDDKYASKISVLQGSTINIRTLASDNNFYPSSLENETITYSVDGNIGKVDAEGKFTAAKEEANGKILAKNEAGIIGELVVDVVDKLDSLNSQHSIISVAPEGQLQLKFTGMYNGTEIGLSNESLKFELSDPSLGTIDESGLFTATAGQGTGTLKVSYQDVSIEIPVEIGKLPIVLNDFERPLEEDNWTWRYFNANGTRGGDGRISINYDEKYVKSGDGSLRIDYDYASNPITGTVTLEAGPKKGYGSLEGKPKAIGVWVYGDGSGVWLRIQMNGGKYAGDTHVDWKGWKYIETEIPDSVPYPYELVWGIRVLGLPNGPGAGKKGTIYVDQLRAVYDFKNDDLDAPVLVGDTTPLDQATGISKEAAVKLTVKDPQIEGQPFTGIDTERTYLKINGFEKKNIQHTTNQDGSVTITYNPSAVDLLRSGENKVRVRVEDNAGNKSYFNWSFNVEGYNVELTEKAPESETVTSGQNFDYIINAKDYKNFAEFNLDLNYDTAYVDLNNIEVDERLTINSEEHDKENGNVKYNISGMSDFEMSEEQPLIRFNFTVKNTSSGRTGIVVNEASVKEINDVKATVLHLDGADREIALANILSFTGGTSGEHVVFSLKDSSSAPIAGATVYQKTADGDIELGMTNEKGELYNEDLVQAPAGTKYEIYAINKFNEPSNVLEFEVKASLGSRTPDKINLTTGENPETGVGVSWETDTSVEAGEVRYSKSQDLSDYQAVAATSRKVNSFYDGHRVSLTWHAEISNLEPGTTYYYTVGQGDEFSEVKQFRTVKDSDNLTVAVMGDLQGKFDQYPKTYQELLKLYPEIDFNIIAGDVADTSNSYAEWSSIAENFVAVDEQLGGSQIWMSAVGNHDSGNDAENFTAFFNGPKNGTRADSSRNYWIELGNTVIYNLDTEAHFDYDKGFTQQVAKMKEVFNNSDKDFRIVLMHRSAYPMMYNEQFIRDLAPEFEKMGVDLVLSGHDHIYNRTTMYNGQKDENGIKYVVTGTSTGGKYYDSDANGRPWQDVVYDDNNPVFNVLKTEKDRLYFEAYAIEPSGTKIIDKFEINKKLNANFDPQVVEGPDKFTSGNNLEYKVNIPSDKEIDKVLVNGQEVEFTNQPVFRMSGPDKNLAWWSVFTKGYELKENEQLIFEISNKSKAEQNWQNFAFVFSNAPNAERQFPFNGGMLRADGYGDNWPGLGVIPGDLWKTNIESNDHLRSVMTDAKATVYITRQNGEVKINSKYEGANGKNIEIATTLPLDPSESRFVVMTGENAEIVLDRVYKKDLTTENQELVQHAPEVDNLTANFAITGGNEDINIEVKFKDIKRNLEDILPELTPEEPGETTEPEVTEPSETTEPEVTEPTEPSETTQPEVTEPSETTKPEATEPSETTEPEVTEPSETTEPEVTEPTETTEREVTEPSETTGPEVTEPSETTEPEVTEPSETTKSEVTEPSETTAPEMTEPSETTKETEPQPTQPTEPEETDPKPSEPQPSSSETEGPGESSEYVELYARAVAGNTWIKGNEEGLELISNGEFASFKALKIDGVEIDKVNYDAYEGSTIVVLKPKFLESLSGGEHTVEFIFGASVKHLAGVAKTSIIVENMKSSDSSTSESLTTESSSQNTTDSSKTSNVGKDSGKEVGKTGESIIVLILATAITLVVVQLVLLRKKQESEE